MPISVRLVLLFLIAFIAPAHAEIKVVTSIKPVHSLVSKVMEGVGEPQLLIKDNASPHTYHLKPSEAKLVEEADLIFWVSPDIESFLEKPLASLSDEANHFALIETPNLIIKKYRKYSSPRERHKNHQKDRQKLEKVSHDHEEHGHGHKENSDDHDDHGHGHDEHDHHGEVDGHIWLDPVNAKHIVREVNRILKLKDPKNAAQYEANTKEALNQLNNLLQETSAMLEKHHDARFVVFHDAYQYFEHRFGIEISDTVTYNIHNTTGSKHMKELREHIEDHGITCLFSEPQFPKKLVTAIQNDVGLNVGLLDPLGSDLKAGPFLYDMLIKDMAKSMVDCFEK